MARKQHGVAPLYKPMGLDRSGSKFLHKITISNYDKVVYEGYSSLDAKEEFKKRKGLFSWPNHKFYNETMTWYRDGEVFKTYDRLNKEVIHEGSLKYSD